jgi:integrase
VASISSDANGNKRVLFFVSEYERRTIHLGKMDRKTAEGVARHIQAILTSKVAGQSLLPDTVAWLSSIGPKLYDKLTKHGLVERKNRATLGEFLNTFIANRKATAAPNTITNLEQAKRRLVEFFGADRDMKTISAADAEAWASALAEKYAPATAGRTIKRARQFLKAALRNKLVTENVFVEVKAAGQANKERQFHVSRDVIFRVIQAAPDAEWRLLIALSRFGGLRCPSEHLALRWQDVDWARNRFRVDSSKTGERWVPIFPELRPYLDECFDQARDGAVHVVTRYRDTNSNLRTTFTKIIKRAGEKPWPKLFHNLRASRETELAAEYPIHVVCEWIGNTAAIAAKHYLEKNKRTQPESHTTFVPHPAVRDQYLPLRQVPPRGLEPLS